MKLEVGDIVDWCGLRGRVVEINKENDNPAEVAFDNYEKENFTLDGKVYCEQTEPCLKIIKKANNEPELYYRWRIWSKDTIFEPCDYLAENSCGGLFFLDGSRYLSNEKFLKKEKISEGVAKVEGQE